MNPSRATRVIIVLETMMSAIGQEETGFLLFFSLF